MWFVPYDYFLLGDTFRRAICFVVKVLQSGEQHAHLGARLLSGSGKKSPLWCLEYKGFGYFFEGKFLPEQKAWSESLLTEPTGRNWFEENQACWSLFTLDLGNWGVSLATGESALSSCHIFRHTPFY